MKISISDFSRPEAQPFFFEGGEHAVLLLHGFTGSVAHMRPLGEKLHEAGFTVKGINLPGHASTLEDMKACTWEDWVGAGRDAVKELRAKYPCVSVAGLSMGGCIALILAEEGLLDAVVPISAPMAAQNKFLPLAGILYPLVPTISWGEGGGPKDHMLDAKYNLGYGGFATKTGAALYKIIKEAKANLGKITCPLMAVQSHGDETIDPDSADLILEKASSGIKEMLWLEEVPHVCVITKELPNIASKAAEFLRSVRKP
ncbi:MAG: alpha/beta fold hydrolase [Clostridia bacterium]|nr:alpha/beta fold hydrolase [Clostridia bacterium]